MKQHRTDQQRHGIAQEILPAHRLAGQRLAHEASSQLAGQADQQPGRKQQGQGPQAHIDEQAARRQVRALGQQQRREGQKTSRPRPSSRVNRPEWSLSQFAHTDDDLSTTWGLRVKNRTGAVSAA